MIYFDLKVYAYDQDGEMGQNEIDIEYMPLMQYTGLKDKNGKEIYEGDIIRWRIDDFEEWTKFQIVWGNDYPAFEINPCEFEECNGLQFITSIEGECEVIGNIYENPELLNAGEK